MRDDAIHGSGKRNAMKHGSEDHRLPAARQKAFRTPFSAANPAPADWRGVLDPMPSDVADAVPDRNRPAAPARGS